MKHLNFNIFNKTQLQVELHPNTLDDVFSNRSLDESRNFLNRVVPCIKQNSYSSNIDIISEGNHTNVISSYKYNKMHRHNNKTQQKVVTNFHFEKFNQSKYFFGDEEVDWKGCGNEQGKLDTSKRFIHINRRNFIYKPFINTDRHRKYASYNKKGKTQGDGIKYLSRELKPLVYKKHNKVETELTNGPFFEQEKEIDYDLDNDNDDLFDFKIETGYKVPLYTQFLKEKIELKSNGNIKSSIKFKLNPEAAEFQPQIVKSEVKIEQCENSKQTQGIFTLATEAISAVSSGVGWYYTYKTADTVKAISDSWSSLSLDTINLIKSNLDFVVVVLSNTVSYWSGKITIDEAFAKIVSYAGGRYVLLPLIKNLLLSFAGGNSTQSTERVTHGNECKSIDYLPAIIGIIATLVLGYQTEPNSFKAILTAIKSLGSTFLTIKTLDTLMIFIIENLPDIIRIILSERFPKLSLYVLVSSDQDLRNQLVNLRRLKSLHMSDIMYNSHNLCVFHRLWDYMNGLCRKGDYANIGIHSMLEQDLEWMNETRSIVQRHGLVPGKRHLPYVIWLCGPPAVGKSSLVKGISQYLLQHLLDKDILGEDFDYNKYMYSFNTANKFFDDYNNQPIFVLNDYLQFAGEEEEKWLIKFADTIEVPLDVSSVDNIDVGIKGEVRFTSRIIIVTSNAPYLASSQKIVNLQAFNRRRDIVIKMDFRDGHNIDFNHFDYSWAKFSRLDPENSLAIQQPLEYNGNDMTNVEYMLNHILISYIHFASREVQPLSFAQPDSKPFTLLKRFQVKADEKSWLDEYVSKAYSYVKDFLDYKIFGVELKYWLTCMIVGSAGYYAVGYFLKEAGKRVTQSLSGDVTTKKVRRIARQLRDVKFTQALDVNIDVVTQHILKNVVGVCTFIKYDERLVAQSMWGVALGGSLLCVPKHLLWRGDQSFKDGDLMKITYMNREFTLTLSNDNVVQRDDTDLAFINLLNIMPAFKSIVNHITSDSEQIHDFEKAVLLTKAETSFVQTVEAYIVEGVSYVDPYGKIYDPKELWQYNTTFRVGDCGSPLLLSDVSHWAKFAGIHVAGDDYSGNAAILTREMVKEVMDIFNSKKVQGFLTDVEMHSFIEKGDGESKLKGNFIYLGSLEKPIYQNSKTDIRPSPFFEVLQEHMTEPAILGINDERNILKESPMLKSIAKFGQEVKPFDNELMEQAFNLVESLYEPIKKHKLKAYSSYEAVNGIYTPMLEKLDLSTSAGYPWVTRNVKKSNLMDQDKQTGIITLKQELDTKVTECMKYLKKNMAFPCTLIATLKDERVSLQKVHDVKTRTFTIFPVEFTIIMRRLFDDFIDKETLHAMEIGTTVGVNIYSSQWDLLYRDLMKWDYHIDGDFKAFDGTIRPEFFRLYARLVNNCYDDEFKREREVLMSMTCFSPMIVLQDVYWKLQGNPSGSRVTTTFNSFVNRMYLAMIYLDSTPPIMHNPTMFKKHIRIFAHGDDHLLGLSTELAIHMNALVIKNFMLSHGIDYTSSNKTAELTPFNDLTNCMYLKSKFVFDPIHSVFKAGLSKEVIQEMVSWQRDLEIESTEMIANTALRYAYFWGKEYFDKVKSALRSAMKSRNMSFDLIDFLILENEYHSTGRLIFDF
jgi:hypothetical protein